MPTATRKSNPLSSYRRAMIDPLEVHIEPGLNSRDFSTPENKAHLAMIKESAKRTGIRTPIHVRWDGEKVVLVGGETRLTAAQELRNEGVEIMVPYVVEERGTNDLDRLFNSHLLNMARSFTMIEQADLVKKLMSVHGLSEADVAKGLDFSSAHINNLVKLLSADEKTKKYVREGRIAATQAVEMLRKYGKDTANRIEDLMTEAAAQGKGKVTAKTARKSKPDGIVYNRGAQNGCIEALQEIYALTDGSQRKIRSIIRNVLENVGAPLEPEEEE